MFISASMNHSELSSPKIEVHYDGDSLPPIVGVLRVGGSEVRVFMDEKEAWELAEKLKMAVADHASHVLRLDEDVNNPRHEEGR